MKIRCFEEEDVNEKIILTRFQFSGTAFLLFKTHNCKCSHHTHSTTVWLKKDLTFYLFLELSSSYGSPGTRQICWTHVLFEKFAHIELKWTGGEYSPYTSHVLLLWLVLGLSRGRQIGNYTHCLKKLVSRPRVKVLAVKLYFPGHRSLNACLRCENVKEIWWNLFQIFCYCTRSLIGAAFV